MWPEFPSMSVQYLVTWLCLYHVTTISLYSQGHQIEFNVNNLFKFVAKHFIKRCILNQGRNFWIKLNNILMTWKPPDQTVYKNRILKPKKMKNKGNMNKLRKNECLGMKDGRMGPRIRKKEWIQERIVNKYWICS